MSPTLIPTLALAYLGDSVIELLVRDMLVTRGICHPKDLNKASRDFVTLESQSNAVENILPILTEDEMAMFKRGRNSKPNSVPKHGDRIQYLRATGLEVLFGYLYKCGKTDRLNELFKTAFLSEKAPEASEE
ncbi:MAG: ribonuclease III [Clostridia bacterium]|nr:ribonuclease III [Clostridia bacterium]